MFEPISHDQYEIRLVTVATKDVKDVKPPDGNLGWELVDVQTYVLAAYNRSSMSRFLWRRKRETKQSYR